MGAILLDTTVLIDLLRGRAGAIASLRTLRETGDDPYACAVNVERGRSRSAPPRARSRPPPGRRHPGRPLGSEQGWQAGLWRRDFAARGQTLSHADCLVAAAALSVGGRLATGNPKHFPMRELIVEHWPAGA